jgi:hypothetical protein
LFVILKLKQHQTLLWHGLVCGIVLLSFFLRVYQLNNIAVDKGEQMSISWFIREGLPYLLTHNKDLNNHPLNSVLAYFTSYGNESIFTLRWHSAVIGVIGVAAILRLAHLLFGRRDGTWPFRKSHAVMPGWSLLPRWVFILPTGPSEPGRNATGWPLF